MASNDLEKCRHVSGEHALVEALYDPIESATISLGNFAPQVWNNAAYKIELIGGQLYLRADQPQALDVRVSGIRLGEDLPEAMLQHSSGRESHCRLLMERSAENDTTEIELLEIESQVFRSMVRMTRFRCPHCGEDHPSHTLRCTNDVSPRFRFHGRPILASLHGSRRKGLFLCSDDGKRVRCEFVGQAFPDGERGQVYFALDRQRLFSATLAGANVDWTSVRRIQANCCELREHLHVVVYH